MTTVFRLKDFFDGPADAYGIFQDRFGRPRRQLRANIEPSFKDGILTLEERFTFDDDIKEERAWSIEPQGGGHYRATANGVIGVAKGQAEGSAIRWRYKFALDIGNRALHVQFGDWMRQQCPSVLINRAVVRKWGIRIGDLTLVFIKQPTKDG